MDDIYTYYVNLPSRVKGFTVPCESGYVVYLNQNLTREAMLETYQHELGHILAYDFERSDVQEIESTAHQRKNRLLLEQETV